MLIRPLVTTLALVPLLAAGCSDDEPDELTQKCESKCQVASKMPPSCKQAQSSCEAACRKLSNEAETKYYPGCGSCIADSFKWVYKEDAPCDKNPADPVCWCNYQHGSPTDTTCKPKCFEPDGSVGY